jgi:DNA replication protein DnaC
MTTRTKAPTAGRPDVAVDSASEWRDERRRGRLERLAERIPPVHRQPGQLHAKVRGWVDQLVAGGHPSLILVGDVGVGKTWQAWHAAESALEAGWDGRVEVVAADEFRRLTFPGDDPGRERAVRVALLAECDLLVLDDVGAHRSTDWYLEALWAVVNRRYEHERPTVVTSNVADLQVELGARIASRLAASAVFVVLDGPDRRRS